jgi:hypothetical protein
MREHDRYWLDHDTVAFAVLVIALGILELNVLGIWIRRSYRLPRRRVAGAAKTPQGQAPSRFSPWLTARIWSVLVWRDCEGSRMRATMKFAVICVSLLIAAHADAAGQRNQMKALDFQERGARLRLELERAYQDLRHTGDFKAAGNDVSSIVKKYVPVGTSFANAETTLRSSGFNIDPLPAQEPPENPSPLWSGERKLLMRFAIFGTLVLAQQGVVNRRPIGTPDRHPKGTPSSYVLND